MRRCAAILLTAAGLVAEDAPLPPAFEVPVSPELSEPRPDGWRYGGKLNAWFQQIASSGAVDSRDPIINGSTDTSTATVGAEGGLMWRRGMHEVEQRLRAKYGEQRQTGRDWHETTDELRYDGVYRTVWRPPQFTYAGLGTETMFTGPAPDKDAFGEGRCWVSGGYGVKAPRLILDEDRGELRLGLRGQQQWGQEQNTFTTGPELFGRYDVKFRPDLKGFAQYEAFAEADDPGHRMNLFTAGLFVGLAKYLTLDVSWRFYHETRPADAPPEAVGYDRTDMRSETQFGAVYTF